MRGCLNKLRVAIRRWSPQSVRLCSPQAVRLCSPQARCELRISEFTSSPSCLPACILPISHASILIKGAADDFLLEGMFANFRFIDFDAQTRPRVGADDAALFVHGKTFLHDVFSPRDIRMHLLANDV